MTAAMEKLADQVAPLLDTKVAELIEEYGADEMTNIQVTIHTNRAEGELVVGGQVSVPYDGWADDLSALPRRKMVLWATHFALLLSERLAHPHFGEQLLTYRWLRRPIACHHRPFLAQVEAITAKSIGDFDHLVPIKGGAVLFGDQGLVVAAESSSAAKLVCYEDIDSAKLDYNDSFSFQTGGELLELQAAVQYEDDPDRQRDFDWEFLRQRIPSLEIHPMYAEKHGISEELVAEQKQAADPMGAITHFVHHQRDYKSAVEAGLAAVQKYPKDIELIDGFFTPLAQVKGFGAAIELFETIRDDIVGKDSVYGGNIIGNALACYAQCGRSGDALQLVRDAWVDEPKALGRIFFHNSACIACQNNDFDLAWKSLAWAAHFGESESDLERESDFAVIRAEDQYGELLSKVASGELHEVKEVVFGPGDGEILCASFARKPDERVLYHLVQTGSPQARDLYESLIRSPHTGENMLASAFFSLIALGDEASLALARELFPTVEERAPMFDFFLDAGEIKKRVKDKGKLRRDIEDIAGEDAAEDW